MGKFCQGYYLALKEIWMKQNCLYFFVNFNIVNFITKILSNKQTLNRNRQVMFTPISIAVFRWFIYSRMKKMHEIASKQTKVLLINECTNFTKKWVQKSSPDISNKLSESLSICQNNNTPKTIICIKNV